MTAEPEICVLLPVWNDQPGLLQTLEVLGQDATPFDIIVVDDGSPTPITCAPQYARFAAERGPAGPPSTTGGSAAGSGCLCGRSVVFVSHTGEIFPCGYLPVSAGSVRLAGLGEIWDKSTVLRSLRDPSRLGAPCKACAYREICGGCRARAYAGSGEMLAGEAGCTPG